MPNKNTKTRERKRVLQGSEIDDHFAKQAARFNKDRAKRYKKSRKRNPDLSHIPPQLRGQAKKFYKGRAKLNKKTRKKNQSTDSNALAKRDFYAYKLTFDELEKIEIKKNAKLNITRPLSNTLYLAQYDNNHYLVLVDPDYVNFKIGKGKTKRNLKKESEDFEPVASFIYITKKKTTITYYDKNKKASVPEGTEIDVIVVDDIMHTVLFKNRIGEIAARDLELVPEGKKGNIVATATKDGMFVKGQVIRIMNSRHPGNLLVTFTKIIDKYYYYNEIDDYERNLLSMLSTSGDKYAGKYIEKYGEKYGPQKLKYKTFTEAMITYKKVEKEESDRELIPIGTVLDVIRLEKKNGIRIATVIYNNRVGTVYYGLQGPLDHDKIPDNVHVDFEDGYVVSLLPYNNNDPIYALYINDDNEEALREYEWENKDNTLPDLDHYNKNSNIRMNYDAKKNKLSENLTQDQLVRDDFFYQVLDDNYEQEYMKFTNKKIKSTERQKQKDYFDDPNKKFFFKITKGSNTVDLIYIEYSNYIYSARILTDQGGNLYLKLSDNQIITLDNVLHLFHLHIYIQSGYLSEYKIRSDLDNSGMRRNPTQQRIKRQNAYRNNEPIPYKLTEDELEIYQGQTFNPDFRSKLFIDDTNNTRIINYFKQNKNNTVFCFKLVFNGRTKLYTVYLVYRNNRKIYIMHILKDTNGDLKLQLTHRFNHIVFLKEIKNLFQLWDNIQHRRLIEYGIPPDRTSIKSKKTYREGHRRYTLTQDELDRHIRNPYIPIFDADDKESFIRNTAGKAYAFGYQKDGLKYKIILMLTNKNNNQISYTLNLYEKDARKSDTNSTGKSLYIFIDDSEYNLNPTYYDPGKKRNVQKPHPDSLLTLNSYFKLGRFEDAQELQEYSITI